MQHISSNTEQKNMSNSMNVVIKFSRVWRRESSSKGTFYTLGECVFEDVPSTLTNNDDFYL